MDELQTAFDAFVKSNGPIINLLDRIQSQSPAMTLAAEFKRASPSKGVINPDVSAGEQAVQYFTAGASVISILTEERWFKGSLQDLTEARMDTQRHATETTSSSSTRPVILRKDFVISKFQILEAASTGADTILLIVAVTPATLLKELIDYSRSLGMEPLVEVHAPEELDVAITTGAKVIGVNNRNLHTFQMDLATTDRTAAQLEGLGLAFHHDKSKQGEREYALCALSGMSTAEDVHRYRQLGVGMVLIGESLMRAADPKAAIAALCLHPEEYEKQSNSMSAGGAYVGGNKIVKVCGVTNPDDALVACRAGANLIGVIFAEKSKRKVDANQAKQVVDAVRKFGERSARVEFTLPEAKGEEGAVSALVRKAQVLQQTATSRRPLVVGVFQNQSSEFIAEMVNEAGIDLVQLHGKEGMSAAAPEKCGGVPALRVVDIPASTTEKKDDVISEILGGLTSDPLAVLLDTTMKGGAEGGGTGVTFDWSIAESIQNRGLPVIIAGGLKPENIGDAVGGVRPWGVDVSSGVEQSPGKKDWDKVKKFVSGARIASEEAAKGF